MLIFFVEPIPEIGRDVLDAGFSGEGILVTGKAGLREAGTVRRRIEVQWEQVAAFFCAVRNDAIICGTFSSEYMFPMS